MRAVVLDDNPVVLAKLPVFRAPVAFVEFGGYSFGLGARPIRWRVGGWS
jgi:hypothetical protein